MKLYKTHQLGGSQAPNYCAGVNDISAHYGLTNLHEVHNRNDLFWHISESRAESAEYTIRFKVTVGF